MEIKDQKLRERVEAVADPAQALELAQRLIAEACGAAPKKDPEPKMPF